MAMPGSVQVSTQATSGTKTDAAFDSSGWNVNFGSQNQGPQVPWYVWAALGIVVLVVLKKGGKKWAS